VTDPGAASFTQVMSDHEDLTQRLAELGSAPVPGDVRADHLHAMRTAEPVDVAPTGPRFGRLAVAAAAIVGFLAGSTGLAMAGALPDPAQGVAHDVLSVVQVQVPDRPDNRGACISAAAKIADPAAKQAAKDQCPKGGPPEGVPGRPQGTRGERPGHAGVGAGGDPCKGRPPWAGKMTTEEREAAKAEHAAQCPGRAQGEPEEIEPDEIEPEEIEPSETESETGEPPAAPEAGTPPVEAPAGDVPPVDPPADEPQESAPGEQEQSETLDGTEDGS
jgi:hypothetical protein